MEGKKAENRHIGQKFMGRRKMGRYGGQAWQQKECVANFVVGVEAVILRLKFTNWVLEVEA